MHDDAFRLTSAGVRGGVRAQDILSHNEFRTEILSNVWKGFLSIAESALQVRAAS